MNNKLVNKLIRLSIKARYMRLSLRARKKLHLMQIVKYKGKEYFLNNGTRVCNCGRIKWNIVENVPFDENERRKSLYICSSQLKLKLTLNNMKLGLFSVYNHRMKYWYNIDLNKSISKRINKMIKED